MGNDAVIQEVQKVIEGHLQQQGITLVDLIYRHEGRDLAVRVFADRPEGGINLAECARLNKGLCFLLDELKIIPEEYILEVSSPGLDRPLKNKFDFVRNRGRTVTAFLNTPLEGKIEWEGAITDVREDAVTMTTAQGKVLAIPFTHINIAKPHIA